MKKLVIVLVLGLALTGCKLFGPSAEEIAAEQAAIAAAEQERLAELEKIGANPEEIVVGPTAPEGQMSVSDFYFESGDDGLTLLSTADPEFKQMLTTRKVLDAELVDGILTFTAEDPDGLPYTEVMNLHEYIDYFNSQK